MGESPFPVFIIAATVSVATLHERHSNTGFFVKGVASLALHDGLRSIRPKHNSRQFIFIEDNLFDFAFRTLRSIKQFGAGDSPELDTLRS